MLNKENTKIQGKVVKCCLKNPTDPMEKNIAKDVILPKKSVFTKFI